eukprot:tig00000042_g15421.t1
MALSAVPRVVYGKLGASFAVVCKPPGMPMEAAGARALSVERWAQDELGGKRVWLPHRLDAHTSGLLVLAFSRSVCAELSRTLPTWLKRYRLLAEVPACVARPHERREGCKIGSPSHIVGSPVSRDGTLRSSGTITSYLAPGTADRDGRCSSNGCHFCGDQAAPHPYLPPGMLVENVRPPSPTLPGEKTSAKKAITQYQLVHMSPSRRRALYEVELRTGRTHQIRTHFAGAGLPILHDPYYNRSFIVEREVARGAGNIVHFDQSHTMALQAFKLSFPSPLPPGHAGPCGSQLQGMVDVELPAPDRWFQYLQE